MAFANVLWAVQIAQQTFQSLKADNVSGPDVQLVGAEIQLARGDNQPALASLQHLMQDGSTPQWIRDRAAEIINSQ